MNPITFSVEWEYAWHYLGPQVDKVRAPRSAREALQLAISTERRAQNFYIDVAENATDDALCAFATEMAVDEQRHLQRLEQLLAREPELSKPTDAPKIGPVGAASPRNSTSARRSGRSQTKPLSRTVHRGTPRDDDSPVSGSASAIRRTSSQVAMGSTLHDQRGSDGSQSLATPGEAKPVGRRR